MAMSTATRETVYRDLTEAMLRLKLARIQRNRKDIEVFEKRLNWLLDRLCRDNSEQEEMAS